jgi:hypothetical protein
MYKTAKIYTTTNDYKYLQPTISISKPNKHLRPPHLCTVKQMIDRVFIRGCDIENLNIIYKKL